MVNNNQLLHHPFQIKKDMPITKTILDKMYTNHGSTMNGTSALQTKRKNYYAIFRFIV